VPGRRLCPARIVRDAGRALELETLEPDGNGNFRVARAVTHHVLPEQCKPTTVLPDSPAAGSRPRPTKAGITVDPGINSQPTTTLWSSPARGSGTHAVAAGNELLSLLNSIREVRRRDIELAHAGMQPPERTGVAGW
jgi:hypothetical protein